MSKFATFKSQSSNETAATGKIPGEQEANGLHRSRRPRSFLPQRISTNNAKPRPSSCLVDFPFADRKPNALLKGRRGRAVINDPLAAALPRRAFFEPDSQQNEVALFSCSAASPINSDSVQEPLPISGDLSDDSWSCFSFGLSPDKENAPMLPANIPNSPSSSGLVHLKEDQHDGFQCTADPRVFSEGDAFAKSTFVASGHINRSIIDYVVNAQKDDPILMRMTRFSTSPASPDSGSSYPGSKVRLTASPDLKTTPREQLRDLFSSILSRSTRSRVRPISMSVAPENKYDGQPDGLGLSTIGKEAWSMGEFALGGEVAAGGASGASPCPRHKQVKFSPTVRDLTFAILA